MLVHMFFNDRNHRHSIIALLAFKILPRWSLRTDEKLILWLSEIACVYVVSVLVLNILFRASEHKKGNIIMFLIDLTLDLLIALYYSTSWCIYNKYNVSNSQAYPPAATPSSQDVQRFFGPDSPESSSSSGDSFSSRSMSTKCRMAAFGGNIWSQ